MRVVAFAGQKGAGKDTAAAVFVEKGFTNLKFADGLKAMLRAFLAYRGVPDVMIERMLEGDLKEVPSPALGGRTPRFAMQALGDGWGRDMMHPNLWADATADAIDLHPLVVISDLRRANELDVVREKGGEAYLIERAGGGEDAHASEQEFASLRVNARFENSAPTADLFKASIRASFFA